MAPLMLCPSAVSEDHRSTERVVAGLFGEVLREMAVLIAVFAPLDRILEDRALTLRFMVPTISFVVVFLGLGIYREVKMR